MRQVFGVRLQTLLLSVALVALLGLVSPHFLTVDNLLNVAQQSAINALLGLGLTFVIISGGIDLSVGSILALSGLVGADLLVHGHPTWVAVLAALGVGIGCGLINGLMVARLRLPAFISTLGMMLVARSVAKIYSDAQPISGLPASLRAMAGSIDGVPLLPVLVLSLYGVAHAILRRTKLGRYCYAIGGNEEAAWLSGVPVARYKLAVYALSGGLAALGGVLLAARLNAASPLAGDMYELYAIAAAVLGGVSLLGGEGNVAGTLVGAVIMGTLRNGLNLLNVPAAWEGVAVGGVLVLAVLLDRRRPREAVVGAPGTAVKRDRAWRRTAVAVGLSGAALVAGWTWRLQHPVGAAATPQHTIAFIPKNLGSPFWLAMEASVRRTAAQHNIRLLVVAPEREVDVERQHQLVENMVERHVDAILLAPCGARELLSAIRKANDAGVAVFLVDSDVDPVAAKAAGAQVVTYIGSDNYQGGELAGEYLARRLSDQGDVALIEGTFGHETVDARRLGFRAALAKHPSINVVASQTANAERDRAYTVAENILAAHPDLDAFFAVNDEMALGALQAVLAAGPSVHAQVLGFDAEPEAVARIRAGAMLGAVAQHPDIMGRMAVESAVAYLHHLPVPRVQHTPLEIIDASNVAQRPNASAVATREAAP